MIQYPLTKGLLVSMAMRIDHGFGLYLSGTELSASPIMAAAYGREPKLKLLEECYHFYNALKMFEDGAFNFPDSNSTKMLEEITGTGFYKPESEEQYAKMWPEGFEPGCFKVLTT